MRKIIIGLALVGLLVPVLAQAKTLEDLLVEKGVITKSEARAAASGAGRVYWDNGTRLEFPDVGFSTRIATHIKARYEFTDNDNADNTSSFEIPTARLKIDGSVLNNEFTYVLQLDFTKSSGSGTLLDAALAWHPSDFLSIKAGQFKTGVSRQFNTSSPYLQFAERTLVSDTFDLGRQQGAQIGVNLGDVATVGVGLFNGSSAGEGINSTGVDTDHAIVVNARANVVGEMNPYVEADVDGTEDLAINVGGAYAFSTDKAAGISTDHQVVSVDANLKWQGFSFNGEFFWEDFDPDNASSRDHWAFYVQAGYFFLPQELELAARWGYMDCDNGHFGSFNPVCKNKNGQQNDIDTINEVAVNINYYWWKHNLKAQVGWYFDTRDPVNGSSIDTNRWLLQLSSYF
ncbi:MAG: hypothetical protein D6780_06540 [Candidatus Dadabacteria bacterium]|nr:MAG: hypothetical protein D6780_06540 [Candidatus Dadabacteria bacterium]